MFELIVEHAPSEQDQVNIVFELNDIVKVRKINDDEIEQLDAEDYYYIKDFMNKKGKIVDIKCNSSNGIYSYKVEFDREIFGYFYDGDLISL